MNSNDFLNEDIVTDAHDMHQDHEVQMARQECYHAAERAIAIHKLLRHVNEAEGLEGWVSAKITLANDYLKTVNDYLEYQLMTMNSPVQAEVLPIAESQQGVAEGYKFKGGFPFDVDHMNGPRGIGLSSVETKKFFTDKQQWTQAVNKLNSSLYNDDSNFIGITGRSTVEIDGHEWARWSDAEQKGYVETNPMSQGVAEGEKWIQKAVNPKTKGDLHKALHVPQDETIPKSKIDKATHSKNAHLRHMAQFAKNVTKEDASAGASSSGSVATVVKGGSSGTNLLGGPVYKGPNPFKKKKSK